MKVDFSSLEGLNLPPEQIAALKGQITAQASAEFKKQETEFSRYKQDCRKRALDLAHSQMLSIKKYVGDTPVIDKDGKAYPFEMMENELLITMADRYYDWLITIPEKVDL